MDLVPPDGSKISISQKGTEPIIIIPQTGSPARYVGGLFLLFWLGGWAAGFSSALGQISAGKGNAFLVFWLGAWTLGGGFAAITAYRLFRPSVPETLALGRNRIAYDGGIAPLELSRFNARGNAKSFRNQWAALLPKRTRVEITAQQLQSLRLREADLGNRLTVDVGATRIDLALSASEVEREWLAHYLTHRYGLQHVVATSAKP